MGQYYSGISLVRSARDWDFLYGLNVVRTKRYDLCSDIFIAVCRSLGLDQRSMSYSTL